MKIFLFILTITLLNLLAVGQSLQFALNGDDWQALWRYIKDFTSFESHFDINKYSTDYGNYVFANHIMGFIYRIFEFNPFPYYFCSIVLRIIAALSFFPAVFKASGSKLAAYLSSFFFSCMYAGIETTNWVFNMNTYISIAFFNFFLYIYFSEQFKAISKKGLLASLTLALSYIITQNRMHGLLFIIPLLAALGVKRLESKGIKEILSRLFILYTPFFLYRFFTRNTSDLGYIDTILQTLNNPLTITKTLFASIGNSIMPGIFLNWRAITPGIKAIITILLILLLIYLFYKVRHRYKKISNLAFLCLTIIPTFLIMPLLLFDSSVTLESDQRYLTIPGAYMMVTLSLICSMLWLAKNQFFKTLSLLIILVIIGSNTISLKNYFAILSSNGRLWEDAKKQFNYISSQIEKPNNDAPLVFLFIPDNPFYLYNAITFGFSYHLILIDSRFSLDIHKSPIAVESIESLLDILSSPDSLELKRYGYSPIKIPIENVYGFQLQNKLLTNITPQLREYLTKQLPSP